MTGSGIRSNIALIFSLLFILALVPVLCFAVPAAMVDYPNHLARMFILSRDGTAQAHPYYQVSWSVIPNLAMDLLVPRVGRLIGVETATRLFYLLSQILIVTGAMSIERAVKGRVHIAGFIALMFLYSLPFTWGFLNFEFGLGCALWGFAAALIVLERPWPVRLALHSALVAGLFAAHMFALGIYGFAIGMHELWRARSRCASLPQTVGRLAMPALPAIVLLGVMIGSGGAVGGRGTHWFFGFKPLWILHIMSGYSLIASAAGVVALIVFILALRQRDALWFEQSGAWFALGFAALYIAMPSKLLDTSFVDLRIIVAAALILPGFISVKFPGRPWALASIAGAAAITLLNAGVVLAIWFSYRADYAAAEASFSRLPKGALVLVGHSGEGADPPLGNLGEYPIYGLPTLAVQYADAFVPNLFTAPGKQPVTVRADLRRLDVPYAGPAPLQLLKSVAEHRTRADTPGFIRTWQRDFDYLYVVGPPVPNPMPDRLEIVSAAPRFTLYRIRKTAR